MERSTIFNEDPSTISTGPWLQRTVSHYQRVGLKRQTWRKTLAKTCKHGDLTGTMEIWQAEWNHDMTHEDQRQPWEHFAGKKQDRIGNLNEVIWMSLTHIYIYLPIKCPFLFHFCFMGQSFKHLEPQTARLVGPSWTPKQPCLRRGGSCCRPGLCAVHVFAWWRHPMCFGVDDNPIRTYSN